PWVAITALVPRVQQEQEYVAKLQEAASYDPSRDAPQYTGYQCERAEVTNEQTPLEWKPLASSEEFQSHWENTMPDIVLPKEVIESALEMPLGPLVGTEWTPAAIHPVILNWINDKSTFEQGMSGMGPGGMGGGPPPGMGGGPPGGRGPDGRGGF